MMARCLEKKAAIITGGNQGFGLEVARQFVLAGSHVALCARNDQLLRKVQEELRALGAPSQKILAIAGDVSKPADVDHIVREALAGFGDVDVLVNNAGIYGPKGPIEGVDWAEWVKAIEINLFGSILMCRAILPAFKGRKRGKIIQLSGGGATNPLPNLSAYAVSKAAVVRFVETLAQEVQEYHIDVNAIAPGPLNTRMLAEILEAGPERVGKAFFEKAQKQMEDGGAPLLRGAELAVFLGSARSDGITGKLISAIWDKWEEFPDHLKELQGTDVFTLRRITGKDRGCSWGDK